MSKKTENNDDLVTKKETLIFRSENEVTNYINMINNKITEQDEQINVINLEVNNLKEFIDKTREFLLLEIESSLDKYKQLHIKNKNKIDYLTEFFENELADNHFQFDDELSFIHDESTGDNDVLDGIDATVLIQDDSLENSVDLNELDSKSNLIMDLNNEIEELNEILSSKNNKINNLNQNIADNDEIIMSFTNHINHLDEKIDIYKMDLMEKEKTIKLLIAENNILKSVIDEKDKTINSLNH